MNPKFTLSPNSPDPFSARAQLSRPSQIRRCSATDEDTDPCRQPAPTSSPPAHMPSPFSTRSAALFSCCANEKATKVVRRLIDKKVTKSLTSCRGSWQWSRRARCACAVHRESPYLQWKVAEFIEGQRIIFVYKLYRITFSSATLWPPRWAKSSTSAAC